MTTLLQNFIHYSGRLVSKRTSLKKMESGVGTVWSSAEYNRTFQRVGCLNPNSFPATAFFYATLAHPSEVFIAPLVGYD